MSVLIRPGVVAAQQADQDLKNTWAEVITRFSLGNYRHANLLHNDPHPGKEAAGLLRVKRRRYEHGLGSPP